MAKISQSPNNDFCPQTLFLYGTLLEDGSPNFGLFCWFSYYWDEELGVMAGIGGPKRTLERIHATKVFSANLVTEKLLPLADYFGSAAGDAPGKMDVPFDWERGAKLNVPVLCDSPVAFELEAAEFLPHGEAEVILCKIRNVLMDETLADPGVSAEEKLRRIAPIRTTCATYFGWDGRSMGAWHEPGKAVRPGGEK